MNDTKTYLHALPFWGDLSMEEQQDLEDAVYVKHFEPGEMVYGGADDCLGMLFILSGEIRAYLLSDEGREITLYRLQQEELFVLSSRGVISQVNFETHMDTTQETDVLVLPATVFENLLDRNVYARCFIYELAAQRFSVIMWVLQQILFARFDQRLASFLMEEYRRTESSEICMTQEQIAEYVNSAREVVARMLRRFAADGLIENRRGVIELKDIPALQKLGEVIPPLEEFTKSS